MSAGRVFEAMLPIAAPAPAGVVIAAQAYREVYGALGAPTVADPWAFWPVALFAVFAAAAGCFAMIGCEMQAYRYAFVAVAEGERKAALLAFLLALFCTGLVVWSVGTKDASRPLVAAVLVSVVAYVIRAIRDYMARKRGKQAEQEIAIMSGREWEAKRFEQERAAINAARLHELAMEREKTAQERAHARAEKSATAPQPAQPNPATSQPLPGRIDPVALAAAMVANPNATHAQLGQLFGVSGSAVGKYLRKQKVNP